MSRFRILIHFVVKEFLLAGHLMAVGAAAVGALSSMLFAPAVSPWIFFSIYLFVQPIYWYDRKVGFAGDQQGNRQRSAHYSRYIHYIPWMCAAYMALFVIVMGLVYPDFTRLLLGGAFFVLGMLYASHFKQITKIVPGFKNYFVGLFFVLFAVYTLYNELAWDTGLIFFLLYIFSLSVMVQIFFDLKDMEDDKEKRLKTIPVLIGERNTYKLLFTLSGGLLLLSIMMGFLTSVKASFVIAAGLIAIIYAIILVKAKKRYTVNLVIITAFQYLILLGAAMMFGIIM